MSSLTYAVHCNLSSQQLQILFKLCTRSFLRYFPQDVKNKDDGNLTFNSVILFFELSELLLIPFSAISFLILVDG